MYYLKPQHWQYCQTNKLNIQQNFVRNRANIRTVLQTLHSNSSSLFVSHEQWQIAWLVWCATWMPLTFGLFLFKLTGGGRQQSRESCPLNITEHAGSCWVLHPGRGCPVWMGNPWVVTVVTVYDIGTDPWCIFWEKKGGGGMWWLLNLLKQKHVCQEQLIIYNSTTLNLHIVTTSGHGRKKMILSKC